MGLNNEYGAPVIFDLESVAHERAAELLPPPDLEYLTPPKNYTKADTIEKWKAEEKLRRQKAWEDELERCSLDPDLNRIVAIGMMHPTDPDVTVRLCRDERDERDALEVFWGNLGPGSLLVGYNCVAFDVPTLLRRSLLLGVKARGIQLSRYRHPGIVDLMKVLNHDGLLTTWRSQPWYLKRFGLDADLPKDDHTGADIALLVNEGKWDAVEHHVRCDVLGARALARFMGILGEQPAEVL